MDNAEYKNIKSKHLNALGNEGSKTLLIKKPHLRQGEIQFFTLFQLDLIDQKYLIEQIDNPDSSNFRNVQPKLIDDIFFNLDLVCPQNFNFKHGNKFQETP